MYNSFCKKYNKLSLNYKENIIVQSQEENDISISLQFEREAISLITSQINNPLYKSKNGEDLLNIIKKFYKIL